MDDNKNGVLANKASAALEQEVANMEVRLQNVKQLVEVERQIWKESAQPRHCGKKCRAIGNESCAKQASTKGQGATPKHKIDSIGIESIGFNTIARTHNRELKCVIPSKWDALQVAQYLKSEGLGNLSHVVIQKQISGLTILETSVDNLQNLCCSSAAPSVKRNSTSKLIKSHITTSIPTELEYPIANITCEEIIQVKRKLSSLQKKYKDEGEGLQSAQYSSHSESNSESCSSNNNTHDNTSRMNSPRRQISHLGKWKSYPARKTEGLNDEQVLIISPSCGNKVILKRKLAKKLPELSKGRPCHSPIFLNVITEIREEEDHAQANCSNCRCELKQKTVINDLNLLSLTRGQLYHRTCNKCCLEGGKARLLQVHATGAIKSCNANNHLNESLPSPKFAGASPSTLNYPISKPGKNFAFIRTEKIGNCTTTILTAKSLLETSHLKSPRPLTRIIRGSNCEQWVTQSNGHDLKPRKTIDHNDLTLSGSSRGNNGHSCSWSGSTKPRPINPSLRTGQLNNLSLTSDSIQVKNISINTDVSNPLYKLDTSCNTSSDTSRRLVSYLLVPMDIKGYATSKKNKHASVNFPLTTTLISYCTLKSFYYLSLSCKEWFTLVHGPSTVSARIWRYFLQQMYLSSRTNSLIYDINLLERIGIQNCIFNDRPKQQMALLQRHLVRVSIGNLKILAQKATWQFAQLGSATKLLIPQQHMYEEITAIITTTGDIVAVQAQELIQPVSEVTAVSDILIGIQRNTLARVQCYKLRLFSSNPSNYFSSDDWKELPLCKRAFITFMPPMRIIEDETTDRQSASVYDLKWHHRLLKSTTGKLHRRLLTKESVCSVVNKIQKYGNAIFGQTSMTSEEKLHYLEEYLISIKHRNE